MTFAETRIELTVLRRERGLVISWTNHCNYQAAQRMVSKLDELISQYETCLVNGNYEVETTNEIIGRR